MPIDVEVKCTYKPKTFTLFYNCITCNKFSDHVVDVRECMEVLYTCSSCGSKRNTTISREAARFVYMISDPRNDRVLYVGSSDNPIQRYMNHIAEPREGSKSQPMFADLLAVGVLPALTVIDAGNRQEAFALEQQWIQHFQTLGHPLRNRPGKERRFNFSVTHVAVNEEEEPPQ